METPWQKMEIQKQFGLATLYLYSADYRIPSSEKNIKLGIIWLKKSAEQKYRCNGMLADFYKRRFQANKNI